MNYGATYRLVRAVQGQRRNFSFYAVSFPLILLTFEKHLGHPGRSHLFRRGEFVGPVRRVLLWNFVLVGVR